MLKDGIELQRMVFNVEANQKRRKYVGIGRDEALTLGVLEGDILRLLWDAGEPQSTVDVYEAMHFSRRAEKREMQSPSTIAVTLSRMVEKGILTVKRLPRGGKGFYGPTISRAEVVARVIDDVSQRLNGVSLGYLLSLLIAEDPAGAGERDGVSASLRELVVELRRRQLEDKPPRHEES